MTEKQKNKILKTLPNKVIIKNELIDKYTAEALCDAINEYLSDKYGYCNNGYNYDVKIEITNIDWDLED